MSLNIGKRGWNLILVPQIILKKAKLVNFLLLSFYRNVTHLCCHVTSLLRSDILLLGMVAYKCHIDLHISPRISHVTIWESYIKIIIQYFSNRKFPLRLENVQYLWYTTLTKNLQTLKVIFPHFNGYLLFTDSDINYDEKFMTLMIKWDNLIYFWWFYNKYSTWAYLQWYAGHFEKYSV